MEALAPQLSRNSKKAFKIAKNWKTTRKNQDTASKKKEKLG